MKRTRVSTLLALAVVGAGLGWIAETMLVTMGRPALVPPLTLPTTLAVLAAVVLALAWPVRQSVRGDRSRRVDPFRATRIVLLAKASSLSGSVLGGVALGILLFLGTRPVVAQLDSLVLSAGAAVGAAVLLTCGLVAEHWCTVPPDDPSEGPGRTAPVRPGTADSPR